MTKIELMRQRFKEINGELGLWEGGVGTIPAQDVQVLVFSYLLYGKPEDREKIEAFKLAYALRVEEHFRTREIPCRDQSGSR